MFWEEKSPHPKTKRGATVEGRGRENAPSSARGSRWLLG